MVSPFQIAFTVLLLVCHHALRCPGGRRLQCCASTLLRGRQPLPCCRNHCSPSTVAAASVDDCARFAVGHLIHGARAVSESQRKPICCSQTRGFGRIRNLHE